MELSAEEDECLQRPCMSACDGSTTDYTLGYVAEYGILDEASFPFLPFVYGEYPDTYCPPCNLQGQNPTEIIS